MKKFEKGATLYEDNYIGRVKDSLKLYDFRPLKYSDHELIAINQEIKTYLQTGVTKRTNEELWDMYYVVKGNVHPETEKPLQKCFRWSSFVPVNIPIIMGVTCMPPTPFNQIFFQSLNQSYNFGLNVVNSSANNEKNTTELITSYIAAVSSAIVGSTGLREIFIRMKLQGSFGKTLIHSHPCSV